MAAIVVVVVAAAAASPHALLTISHDVPVRRPLLAVSAVYSAVALLGYSSRSFSTPNEFKSAAGPAWVSAPMVIHLHR
jgi:hypothetical protein